MKTYFLLSKDDFSSLKVGNCTFIASIFIFFVKFLSANRFFID